MLSTDELLKPRIIVENLYPNSPFQALEIICEPSAQQTLWANKYPYLFRWLNWWEARPESDLPEYLHCICSDFITFVKGQIIGVEKHQSNTFNQYVPWLFISKEKQSPEAITNCFNYKNFIPATREEYENQNQ